jgi:hypothetical protein
MQTRSITPLGDLIAEAFEKAAQYSSDPHDMSRLAQRAVRRRLRHTHWDSTQTSIATIFGFLTQLNQDRSTEAL